MASSPLERGAYRARHRLCVTLRGAKRGSLGHVGHASKLSHVLLRYEPEVKVGCALHQRKQVDALDSRGSLYRRDEAVDGRTELRNLGGRHFSEIQEVPPGLE